MGPSPTGPFKPMGKILSQDFKIARGAGHHSVVNVPGTDDWYIAYHRRPLDEDSGERRQLAIDRMIFNADGTIAPVKMTNEGVAARPLPARTANKNGRAWCREGVCQYESLTEGAGHIKQNTMNKQGTHENNIQN